MIWRPSNHRRIAKVIDFFTVIIGFLSSYSLWTILFINNLFSVPKPFNIKEENIVQMAIIGLLYVYLLDLFKAYSYQRFTSLLTEFKNVLKVSQYSFTLMLVYFFLSKKHLPARTFFGLSFILIVVLLFIQKSLVFYLVSQFRKRGYDKKKTLLVGTGDRTKKFIQVVHNNIDWGLDIMGLITCDEKEIGIKIDGVEVLDSCNNFESILKKFNPEEVIITLSSRRFDLIGNIITICEKEGVVVRFNSDFFGKVTKNITFDKIFDLNIISFNMVNHSEFSLLIKRFIDITGSVLAITFFAPFMITAAIGIWISDGRPILYNWNVIGKNKKLFKSWKFRTMVKDADEIKKDLIDKNEMDGPVFKIKDDPRIIPFGRWLRKWSIDETPQLFSVLKGDMSLVGPRPAGPQELERYESWHRRKLSIKPGITCLWQVNGRNKINKFDDWVKLDLEYIDNWSLMLDFKILLKTIPAVLMRKGAS